MMFPNYNEGVESAIHYYPHGWGGRTQGKQWKIPLLLCEALRRKPMPWGLDRGLC